MKLNEKILRGLSEAETRKSINEQGFDAFINEIKRYKLDTEKKGEFKFKKSDRSLSIWSMGDVGGIWSINIDRLDHDLKTKEQTFPLYAVEIYVNEDLVKNYEEMIPISVINIFTFVNKCQDELIKLQKQTDSVIKKLGSDLKTNIMPKYGYRNTVKD